MPVPRWERRSLSWPLQAHPAPTHVTIVDLERNPALRILPTILRGEPLSLKAVMRPCPPAIAGRRAQRAEVYHICLWHDTGCGGKYLLLGHVSGRYHPGVCFNLLAVRPKGSNVKHASQRILECI